MSVDFKTVRDAYELTGLFEGLMGAKGKSVSGGLRYPACPSCGPSSMLLSNAAFATTVGIALLVTSAVM